MSDPSRIVAYVNNLKKQAFLSNILGVFLLPICCIGCVWFSDSKDQRKNNKYLFDIVDSYTANKLNLIAPIINQQHEFFLKACLNINKEYKGHFHNITLIDVLSLKIPVLGCLRSQEYNDNKKEYLTQVFDEYMKLGGQPDQVLYGMPEYIALILDLTEDGYNSYYDSVEGNRCFKLLSTPTLLRDTCKQGT